MKIREDMLDALLDEVRADRRQELKLRLTERGKVTDLDRDEVREKIDRLFERARLAGVCDPHDCARLVELFFLLSPKATASATCRRVIDVVLDNDGLDPTLRIDFLYRHVLQRTSWPD